MSGTRQRYILLLGLALWSIMGTSQQLQWEYGRNDYNVPFEDVIRHFIVHVPEAYTGNEPVPVVFMLHGTTGDGEKFWNISKWKELAEEENFITVFPSSWHYYITTVGHMQTKWNTANLWLVVGDTSELKDDVGFISRIIDGLIETFNIDQQRIYASGFSNGAAFMHSRIIPELNHRIAAVGASGAVAGQPFEVEGPVPPTITMIGSRDETFLENHPDSMIEFSVQGILQDTLLSWMIDANLQTFQLEKEYTVDSTALTLGLHFDQSLSGKDNTWTFILVQGMGHIYPNGNNNPLNIEVAPFYWDFFQQHELDMTSSTLPVRDKFPCDLPNLIAGGTLDLSCEMLEATMNVQIMDLAGRVWVRRAVEGGSLDVSHLPPGMYIITIDTGGEFIYTRKIVRL